MSVGSDHSFTTIQGYKITYIYMLLRLSSGNLHQPKVYNSIAGIVKLFTVPFTTYEEFFVTLWSLKETKCTH